MKRIKNIDLLRAGAILYIMLYHCYVLSWLAGFYEKTLHPYHASVLRLRYSSSDFYVNTDVQQ